MTIATSGQPRKLRVAIIGGGPAGLGAAIALGRHNFVDWTLYEKKPEISEIGNGISIQPHTWRMLEKLGAAKNLTRDQFFRAESGDALQHRNGRTGVLVYADHRNPILPPHRESCRAYRARLQQALYKEIDPKRVQVGRKLTGLTQLASGRVRIDFELGDSDEVDLLVGADGLRSVVRTRSFPSHQIAYTGTTCYRAIVKWSEASKINAIPREVTFWHGTDRKWVYTCPLEGDDLEITCAIPEDGGEERHSWGRPASVAHFQHIFREMCPPIRQLLELVTEVDQYDYFAGPRLTSLTKKGNTVLIGDASHPLSGAFGAGAGFALEDAYVLGEAVEWAAETGRPLADALQAFDSVRSPHYKALYAVLDGFKANEARIEEKRPAPDEEIRLRIEGNWGRSSFWMVYYEVEEAWRKYVEAHPGTTEGHRRLEPSQGGLGSDASEIVAKL